MRAGELARLTGVSTDTLRHYERRGLLRPRRLANGYREYPAHAVDRVRMIRSALAIGFSLDDLSRILRVRDQGGAPCREVRVMAEAKLEQLEALIGELTATRDEMRLLLKDWDERLSARAGDEPARLLEVLTALELRDASRHARLIPISKRRRSPEE